MIVLNICFARTERWLEQEVIPRQTAARLDDNGAGRWEGTALLSHLSPATQYEARCANLYYYILILVC